MSISMKTAFPAPTTASTRLVENPIESPVESSQVPSKSLWGTLSAYFALTKPQIIMMILLTVAVGYAVAARGQGNLVSLFGALIGTAFAAAGSSAWNQVIERHRDARMPRTIQRPLPSGRLKVVPAALFATALPLIGLGILLALTNPVATAVTLATFLSYVLVYTPLKPVTTLNTVVGAIPGALPPLIGWAAATGSLNMEAVTLFLILFLWQFPHFLAIAWIYRDDYRRGGLRMLPTVDRAGAITGRQTVGYALILIPTGLLPTMIGMAGPIYFFGALVAGLFYLTYAIRFCWNVNDASARALLWSSVVYLPTILLLLVFNPV